MKSCLKKKLILRMGLKLPRLPSAPSLWNGRPAPPELARAVLGSMEAALPVSLGKGTFCSRICREVSSFLEPERRCYPGAVWCLEGWMVWPAGDFPTLRELSATLPAGFVSHLFLRPAGCKSFFFNYYFLCMGVVPVCACTPQACSIHRGGKREMDPPGSYR